MRARARGRDVCGIVVLDKPRGPSSNQVLQRVKRMFQAAKAGHAGSLDPLATGVLPICLGRATKLSAYLLDARKTYAVHCRLDQATTTGDAEGCITVRHDGPAPGAADVLSVLAGFQGEIEQVPPMHSALKRDGRPLYELARRGLTVPRPARRVNVHAIALEAYGWPELRFEVTCSKGTYVRTLVEDIACKLGTAGHVTGLRRLAAGPYGPRHMTSLEALECRVLEGGLEALDAGLLPLDSALPGWPRVVLGREAAHWLAHGRKVEAAPSWPRGRVAVFGPLGALLAIGEVTADGCLAPHRVFLECLETH